MILMILYNLIMNVNIASVGSLVRCLWQAKISCAIVKKNLWNLWCEHHMRTSILACIWLSTQSWPARLHFSTSAISSTVSLAKQSFVQMLSVCLRFDILFMEKSWMPGMFKPLEPAEALDWRNLLDMLASIDFNPILWSYELILKLFLCF